jgi:hypothetical protein
VGDDLLTMFLCGDASGPGRRWLAGPLGRISRPFGPAVELAPDGLLVLHPPAGRR